MDNDNYSFIQYGDSYQKSKDGDENMELFTSSCSSSPYNVTITAHLATMTYNKYFQKFKSSFVKISYIRLSAQRNSVVKF